jgi:hypothetical protein
MEIAEAQKKKDELEQKINLLVSEFENETKLNVRDIRLDRREVTVLGDKYCSYVHTINLEVKFKERL